MPKPKRNINASTEIEMSDGTKLKLTISWGLLIKLRALNKQLYSKFSGVVMAGAADDVLKMLDIVYCGYICQYIEDNNTLADALTQDEFIAVAPADVEAVTMAAMELISPKKMARFQNRSESAQGN
ncbi:hypothetical protein DXC99_05550 [Collinsella sp. TF10-11AT]|uniref:hypothetical protein n=1 Tax=Collinsella sp. TF10-11AT TaxID=2292335 RepID=UPI000E4449C2|nr:hypothetical protein [Collinsella sp. TF10-11AT]RGK62634.1 hypothetical protein DXC99_05550 [Collinsella sp. TF10-11AT]